MEKLLKYLAEQNKHFKPDDALSRLVDEELKAVSDELNENDLFFVQAARGEINHAPKKPGKETDRK